ncbi:hypothetical protein NW767_006974 [Fusarium falciforme]|nr:hypothetical protein NW767_006974 [Fusarium falciforme]
MSQDPSNANSLTENGEDQTEYVWHVTLHMRWELHAPDYPRRQAYVRARPERLEAAAARGLRIPLEFEIDPREAVHGVRFIVIAHDLSAILMPIVAWLLGERVEDLESGNH